MRWKGVPLVECETEQGVLKAFSTKVVKVVPLSYKKTRDFV